MTHDSGWDYPSGSEEVTICLDDDRPPLPALGPALGGSYTRGAGRHIDPVRVLVWALTGVLVVLVVGFMLVRWQHARAAQTQTTASNTSYPLQVAFGDPGTSSSSVCTDETLDPQSGSWSCTAWSAVPAGLSIQQPAQQDGSCTERRVDQTAGRWVCVQN